MTPEQSKIIERAMRHAVSASLKFTDAPCSSQTHLAQAIVCLHGLCGWRPEDAEAADCLARAIELVGLGVSEGKCQ